MLRAEQLTDKKATKHRKATPTTKLSSPYPGKVMGSEDTNVRNNLYCTNVVSNLKI